MRKLYAFLFVLLAFTSLNAYTSLNSIEWGKKYNLSVAAIFKDEAPYFKEWLEYHQLVGVEHFYLYNNGSQDNFNEVLAPYISKGLVTLIDWPDQNRPGWDDKQYKWVYCTQVTAYEDCIKGLAQQETTWLAMIDIDEFLLPTENATMIEVLQKHDDYTAISILWQIYGTSYIYDLPENTLLIESLHMTSDPNHGLNRGCPKMIIKPEFYNRFEWPPHHCSMKGGRKVLQLDKTEAQINHYLNRTISFFMNQKVKSKEHMNNRKLTEEEIEQWLYTGNEMEDEALTIFRYVPELRKRMGYPCN